MKTMRLAVCVMLLCASSAMALSKAEEHKILMGVVHEYELNEDEARMLFAIRRHENGPVGLEFGVGQDYGHKHPARRHRADPRKSLRTQARWAAGTIQKYFDGDVMKFARKWCPKGPTRWRNSVYRLLMTDYAQAPR